MHDDTDKGERRMKETQIAQLAENLRNELSATRRDFHMHPELSGQEQRTAGIVADKLREYGLKVSIGVGRHGVIGLLEGSGMVLPGMTAFRIVIKNEATPSLIDTCLQIHPLIKHGGLSFQRRRIDRFSGFDGSGE